MRCRHFAFIPWSAMKDASEEYMHGLLGLVRFHKLTVVFAIKKKLSSENNFEKQTDGGSFLVCFGFLDAFVIFKWMQLKVSLDLLHGRCSSPLSESGMSTSISIGWNNLSFLYHVHNLLLWQLYILLLLVTKHLLLTAHLISCDSPGFWLFSLLMHHFCSSLSMSMFLHFGLLFADHHIYKIFTSSQYLATSTILNNWTQWSVLVVFWTSSPMFLVTQIVSFFIVAWYFYPSMYIPPLALLHFPASFT